MIFSALFLGVTASAMNDEWSHFLNFQEKFHRKYESLEELGHRFEVFRDNFRHIVAHNQGESVYGKNFTMAVNHFTDLTSEEFKSQYVSGLESKPLGSYGCKTFISDASGVADAWDWRGKGAVTPVKDQGQCGSCWTFSSSGAMEGAWAIAKGDLVSLSEEQLVECATGISYGSHGCNGGQMEGAFKYAISNGMCTEADYPYTSGTGKSGSCQLSTCTPVAEFSSCSDVSPNDQVSLKAAVSQQPVSIAIEADTRAFQSYSSGVITGSACGTSLDHGVLIVGYGEENGIKYWLVKNSWSSSWGDDGYVKIERSDSTNDAGVCGIAMDPSFPSV